MRELEQGISERGLPEGLDSSVHDEPLAGGIYMKIPLHYQMSEYDCGPTTMLNAISYLFEVEEIPPEVIRNIMLYSLDCYNDEGRLGEMGTSRSAMMFLCNWLNGFGRLDRIPVSGQYLSGKMVTMSPEGRIVHALRCHGVVVLRVVIDVWHYILVTGVEEDPTGKGDLVFQVFEGILRPWH